MVIRRLLKRLGLVSDSSPRKYALDISLHPMLESLAQEQQRSPDEVISEIVSSALANDKLDADLPGVHQSANCCAAGAGGVPKFTD